MASQADTHVYMEKLEEAQDKAKESHMMCIKPYWARIYGNSSKGYWANAEGIMHHAATNDKLRAAGYPCVMDYYVRPHVRWCERSENESRKKTTSFSSYSIISKLQVSSPAALQAEQHYDLSRNHPQEHFYRVNRGIGN